MSFKIAVLALFGFFASSFAWADKMGPNGDKFYEEAAHYENACKENQCKAPYSHRIVYSQKNKISVLSNETKLTLKKIAVDQTQVWGDTILEGDYVSTGRTRLDSVLAFYNGAELIGYKIQYSEKAWYTGNCNYAGTRESLKDCQEGRITEGSYVSSDALTYFSDEERYAEFSFSEK